MPEAIAVALLGFCQLATAMAAEGRGIEAGRQLFVEGAQPACGICHTLKDAGASGTVGPNLDELKPDRDKIAVAVRKGVGVMPSYGEQLSASQIDALAAYVARVVRDGK